MGQALNEWMVKYPRTPHMQGSRLQKGDDGRDQISYAALAGKYLVIEEKMDGANAAFSFNEAGELRLQSRGHYLTGGSRESQFGMFKSWATQYESMFLDRFEDRFIVFGEWMYEKHTIFYDNLPHLFLEFDIWDKSQEIFLSTKARRELTQDLPIVSVPVLYEGPAPDTYKDIMSLVGPSTAKTPQWESVLMDIADRSAMDRDRVKKQTLLHDGMEGLYFKVEDESETLERYKWVRRDFLQTILESDGHHQHRMLVPNRLNPSVQLYDFMPLASDSGCSP